MHKRILAGVGTLALAATLLMPVVSQAKENESKKPRLSAMSSIDSKGDNNGLAKFKKHNENRHLKQLVGVVTAKTEPTDTTVGEKTFKQGTLTVKKSNGKLYTFAYDSESTNKYTTFLRKYKATATWNEIMVGDSVHVFATKLTLSTAATFGRAVIVWDKGIWYAEAKGVVSGLDPAGKKFTLTVTIKGIEYNTTVKYDDLTIFLMSDGTVKTAADLANGQNVKVRGAWDAVGKFLFAKKIVIYPAS